MAGLTESDIVAVVDDNPGDRMLARQCLRLAGLGNPLLEFTNGQELLSYLDQVRAGAAATPAVVLLDLNMPGMSGFEVLAAMRADRPSGGRPACYVLTSSADPADRQRALALGAAALITKPDDLDSWVDLLRRLARP